MKFNDNLASAATMDVNLITPAPTGGRRIRVMHVITHLAMGGAEGVTMQLIDALRANFDFSVFAVLNKGNPDPVGISMASRLAEWGVPVDYGTSGRFKTGGCLFAARALNRAMDRRQIDVLHVHTEIPELTCALAGLLPGRPRESALLRTVHNSELWIEWKRLGSWVTERLAYGEVVAVSQAAAKADAAIARRSPVLPAPVIYNGVTAPQVRASQRADGVFRVLFAGRFVRQKGADLLPAILRHARSLSMRTDVEITVAGGGPFHDLLSSELPTCAPGWTIDIRGPIEQLSTKIADFDCILMPSRFEGFSLLQLETLLSGVPLITTAAPGIDEVLPSNYRLAANPEDSAGLGKLLADVIAAPDTYRNQIAALRETLATQWSPTAMAAAYAGHYRALAAAPNPTAAGR